MSKLVGAALKGDLLKVHALILAGADPDDAGDYGDTALMMAAKEGHTEIMKYLIRVGARVNHRCVSDGWTSLMYAARQGSLASVEALIAAGADVRIRNRNGGTALCLACCNPECGEHVGVVSRLLAAGADVNARDKHRDTPLTWAAEYGHVAIMRILLAAGADTTVQNDEGKTALALATENGHVESVALLS
jgi:ankyrin repeat protein